MRFGEQRAQQGDCQMNRFRPKRLRSRRRHDSPPGIEVPGHRSHATSTSASVAGHPSQPTRREWLCPRGRYEPTTFHVPWHGTRTSPGPIRSVGAAPSQRGPTKRTGFRRGGASALASLSYRRRSGEPQALSPMRGVPGQQNTDEAGHGAHDRMKKQAAPRVTELSRKRSAEMGVLAHDTSQGALGCRCDG
ncbi:hypothetical protein CKAH01_04635 [Colletotrichum kahawae]|uniref:Uncharacterized protein n=1 Tax=Colletotrichum kahawae TaxID=34407 RepID=A0AAD9YKK4_COLKA|nr:hypothetical protein CKAH01_04635 [Colletotrichum kahawae]